MDGRLAMCSIPQVVLRELEALAGRHDRSLEREARFVLRSYVEPFLSREERSALCVEGSARLRERRESILQGRHPLLARDGARQPAPATHSAEAEGDDKR